MSRYEIREESQSAHCCFGATVVDTSKRLEVGFGQIPDRFKAICECFDLEDARKVANALNCAAGLIPPPLSNRDLAILYQLRHHLPLVGMTGSAFAVEVLERIIQRASAEGPSFDMLAHLQRQRDFSERTFGPGPRVSGLLDHIRKELLEIEADPGDLAEWIDVAILALDGAWRTGASPQQIIDALVAKQVKNEGRTWPDWRTAPADKAIEHDRSGEVQP